MNIKVGDYVRLKNGEIFKIDENTINYYNRNKDYITNEITKHSENIIDLIEVGDIIKVEGLDEVKEVIDDSFFDEIVFGNDRRAIIDDRSGSAYSEQLKHFKILKVVTHEQFQRMEYKVNEK